MPDQRLAAILAADAAGYARLMAADEAATVAALDAARAVFRAAIEQRQGRVVDMAGDSVLAVFDSAARALEAAVCVQDQLEAGPLPFRIGLHLGDVTTQADGTVYGAGVNTAARLQALADPGGIALSDALHAVVRDRVAVQFDDRGEQVLKNIPHPVRAWFVRRAGAVASGAGCAPARPDKPSIAVLPFQNMSADPEQQYFADGVVEDIITALSRFNELFVVARNSSFLYRGDAIDVDRVARELGVRYVLEGSVRKAGGRLRITAQLIDAATRAHLWADRLDGDVHDVFALQDRITERVVGALAPTLRQAEIERARRKPPASLDAYDYLLRALPHVIANGTPDAKIAIGLLDEALRLHPEYAYAHALNALAHGQVFRAAAGDEREQARARAAFHARRAIELGRDDALALAYGGFILLISTHDVAAAREAVDRAAVVNPNAATMLSHRALVLSLVGAHDEAIAAATRALALSPLDPFGYLPHMAMALGHLGRGEADEAVACAQRAVACAPARYPMSHAWLVLAESARGNAEGARQALAQLAAIIPGFVPARLAGLFDIFPEPQRSRALAILRAAGLVA